MPGKILSAKMYNTLSRKKTKMKNKKLFEVKNFDKTSKNHIKKMASLTVRMSELDIDYLDFLDSGAWCTVETETEKYLMLIEEMGVRQTDRATARIINAKTREAIAGSLEFHKMPKSWDTAFFMAYYKETIEGMAEILENIKDRRDD